MLKLILPLALGTVLSGAVVAFATESPYEAVRHHRAIDHAGFVDFPGPSETPTASLSTKMRARQMLRVEVSLN